MLSKSIIFLGRRMATPVIALGLLFLSSCGKECLKFHSPILPYFVYPTNEIIHVGDSLWIEARIPLIMNDFETGEAFNYSGVELNSNFCLYQYFDTSKFILREDSPQYANNKFLINSNIGKYRQIGNVLKVEYFNFNDSLFFKALIIPKDTGFYSINLGYNPGSNAHGSQVINVNDKKCTHKLVTLCQTFNYR